MRAAAISCRRWSTLFYEMLTSISAIRAPSRARLSLAVGLDKAGAGWRVKVGSYTVPGASESPPDLLFFAGGGGPRAVLDRRALHQSRNRRRHGRRSRAVRGDRPRRYRINDSFGAAAFLDLGFVSNPALRRGERAALRHRLRRAILYRARPCSASTWRPCSNDARATPVALYIGIGQAF